MIGVRAGTMYCLFVWASSEGQRACVRAVAAPPAKAHMCALSPIERRRVVEEVQYHRRGPHRYQMRMAAIHTRSPGPCGKSCLHIVVRV